MCTSCKKTIKLYKSKRNKNIKKKLGQQGSQPKPLQGNNQRKSPLMNVTDVEEVTNLQDIPSRAANATTVVW